MLTARRIKLTRDEVIFTVTEKHNLNEPFVNPEELLGIKAVDIQTSTISSWVYTFQVTKKENSNLYLLFIIHGTGSFDLTYEIASLGYTDLAKVLKEKGCKVRLKGVTLDGKYICRVSDLKEI